MFCDKKVGKEIHGDEILLEREWVQKVFGFNGVDDGCWT
jgi:hypothetical protein